MIHHVYRFGECRIDLSARELHCARELLSLSPKVFDCLAYLIEHRDRAIGRDELIAAVWGRIDVTDTLLGQTVLKARRAIGDTGNEQKAIRTVPRFGYRWIADISVEDSSSTGADASIVPSRAAGQDTHAETSGGDAEQRPVPASAAAPNVGARGMRQWRRAGWVGGVAIVVVAATAAIVLWRPFARHDGDSAAPAASARKTPASRDAVDATAVLPVEIAGLDDWAWLRLGLMDLVATRMRSAGLAVVPSDNVVALMRNGGANAVASAKTVTDGTGAGTVVLPSASHAASGWIVRLRMRAADGSERDVEARNADVIEAGRAATDRLLALLGKHAAGSADATHDLPAGELISRAEAALLTDDLAGARHLLESAPAAAQRSPELRLRLAQIDYRADQLDSARTRLDALLAEVSAESDPVLRARILNGSGVVHMRMQQSAEGERDFSQAIALLDSHNQPAALGQAYTGRAVSHAARGDYDAALADFSRARIALELAGDTLALARVEANEGIVSAKRGRYAEALAAHLRSAQRFERFGALNELALTLTNAAEAQLALLQPVDALATTERAWPLTARLENRNTRHLLQVEHCAALAANGRLSEARTLLDDLAGDAAKDADPLLLARIHFEQAALDFNAGHFDSAALLAATAVTAFDDADYQRERVSAWLLLTRALRAQGKDVDASAAADRLQTWAKDRSASPTPVYATLAKAEREWAARKRDAAVVAYDAALSLAERIDVPADTVQVIASYGSSLIADGELGRASAVVGQAARWADRDFTCALLQVRYYHALGESEAWRNALQRARALAGERSIPSPLERLPVAATGPVAARIL
jgi:DNA-binding winged helix-turn-helix (wHTH) protein/tetratricopeptide (TPR) repeat protein